MLLRETLRYLVRLALLAGLFGLLWQQVWVFRSEPLRTAASRRRAPFPRLTICPAKPLEHSYMLPFLNRLKNGSISITEFYEAVTTKLRGEAGGVFYRDKHTYFSDDEEGLGVWRETFFYRMTHKSHLGHTRCMTFLPSASFNAHGSKDHPIEINLVEVPLFRSFNLGTDGSYSLYVHGEDMPNVGDLPEWATFTENVVLFAGRKAHYVISARRTERVSVRRRPCSSLPGYSVGQCLKECLWQRLVQPVGCRLPHMVGLGVVLPKIGGFMDHLPFCSRLLKDVVGPLYAFKTYNLKTACIKDNVRFNISMILEDFQRLLIDETPFESNVLQRTSRIRKKPLPSRGTVGRLAAVPPPPLPPSTPPPPSLPTPSPPATRPSAPQAPAIPQLPVDVFMHLPKGVSNIDSSDCHCPLACKESSYVITEKTTYDSGMNLNSCSISFSLTFDFTEEIVLETLVVSLTDLLANIGGFMGLFTGVSLYTFAEYAQGSLGKLYENIKLWKS